jgi:hypothetical protein
MKNAIYFILLILTSCQLFELNRKNDFILAGISDGLYKFEYDPSIVLSYQHVPPSGESTTKPDTFRIDLNDDLQDDIMLISDGALSHGQEYRKSYVSTLNTNTYIALAFNSRYVKKINFRDTINENLNWCNVNKTKYILSTYSSTYDHPTPIIEGEWENDSINYLGIHLKEENQFAWCKLRIKIHKDITLFSYAIQK